MHPTVQFEKQRRDGTGSFDPLDPLNPRDELDASARADELRHPILILHSDDDGFVPSGGSHRLASERPDLVTLEVFTEARHTKLWNYDEARWSRAITAWWPKAFPPFPRK